MHKTFSKTTVAIVAASAAVIALGVIAAARAETDPEPNEIIRFLEGAWWNVDISCSPDAGVKLNEYREEMVIKNSETLSVTAFKIREGQDVTKDVTIKMAGDRVILAQEGFEAHGVKKGNFISLEGTHREHTLRFRLYLMEDTYIYQMDVWDGDRIINSQMSYLQRITENGH